MCPDFVNGMSGGEFRPEDNSDLAHFTRACRQNPELALLPQFSSTLYALTGELSENLTESDSCRYGPAYGRLLQHVEEDLARMPSDMLVLGNVNVAASWVKQCAGTFYCGVCLRAGNGEWVVPSTFLRQSPKNHSEIDLTIEVTDSPTLLVYKCEPNCHPQPAFLVLGEIAAQRLMRNASRQSERIQVQAAEFEPQEVDGRFTTYVADIVRAELHKVLREEMLVKGAPPVLIQNIEITDNGRAIFELVVDVKTKLPRSRVHDWVSGRFHMMLGLAGDSFKFEVIYTRLPDPFLEQILAA
jgi:hypothetical protein